MNEAEYHGGCLCGALRYLAAGTARDVCYCHCETCRRASGAPVVAWATFPAAGFAIVQGTLARY